MSASGLVVSRAALSLHRSDDSLCSRDLHVKRRSSGNDVTLTAMVGSLYDHKQHSRCRSVADLSKRDVDTGDKALSTACQRDVPPSSPLQVRGRGGEEVPVDAGCHSNFNNNLDYCYIWNTCTGTATCDSVGDARAPVLPPKQRKSSCRRPYGDTNDSMSIRHVSQSLDQLHVIGGRPVGLSLLPADNDAQVCGSVAALEGTAEEWKRGEGRGVPPLPPPPRPLRKSSTSSSNSSTLPKSTNRSTSSSTTARPVSVLQMTTASSNYTNNVLSSSPPVSTLPPSLPRKTRPRQLSSAQEGAIQRPVNSVDLDSPSPTTNVLRPRFGREYAVPDRRRLAEEFGSKLTSVTSSSSKRTSAPVTSASSIFTFDSTASNNATVVATSATSSISDSNTLPSPSNDIIGSSPSNGFASSSPGNGCTQPPRPAGREFGSGLMHLSPPPHPHQHQSPSLNYIQLDHPGFGNSSDAINDRLESSAHAYRPSSSASVPTPSATSGVRASGGVDYAVIDLVATVAASRVGREHVKQREDALKARLLLQDEAKDGRHLAATDTPPRSGSRLTPSSKHNSRTSLPGSKDSRKLSLALSSRETSQRGWSDQRKLSSQ